MKKGLFIIVMFMASMMVFAVEPTPITMDGTTQDSVKAFIDITNPKSQFVEVGFSTSNVTQSDGVLSGINPTTSGIELSTTNSTNGKAANADDSLYLYGFFYTATPCKIVLSAQSMQGYSDQGTTTTSDRLGFTVTSEEVSDATLTVVKGTNDSDSAVSTNAFVTHTGNTSGKTPVKGFKCIPLKIETTDPITSATSSSTVYYNTTITATIVADGINLEEMI